MGIRIQFFAIAGKLILINKNIRREKFEFFLPVGFYKNEICYSVAVAAFPYSI